MEFLSLVNFNLPLTFANIQLQETVFMKSQYGLLFWR